MGKGIDARLAALEAHRAPSTAGGWNLDAWRAQADARRNMTPAERLAVMLASDLDKWPADRRATMERQWRQAAELETWLDEYVALSAQYTGG